MKHDSFFSNSVVKDLLNSIEDTVMVDVFRFKSENCLTQFKCRFFFPLMRSLAIEKQNVIIFYYGIAGHGKGLVDAMSGWGVKTLRVVITTKDFYYSSSKEVCDYLKENTESKNREFIYLEEIVRDENPLELKLP